MRCAASVSADQRGVLALVLRAQLLHRREGHDAFAHRRRMAAQPLVLDHDDLFQPRQFVQRGQHLVGLLLVLAHHDVDVGMAEHIGHLRRGAGRVDPDRHAADQAGAHLGQHPLDAVFRDHADVAAVRQSERAQAQPEERGPAFVIGPGDRIPDAEVLLADGDAARRAQRLLVQHLRQRLVGQRGGLGHGGSGCQDSQRLRRL